MNTICAIANIGPERSGKIIIGVTDNNSDKDRIKSLDNIEPKKVGRRYVVGVSREAKALGMSLEDYFSIWKKAIKQSDLSANLRDSILSNMDFNEFYGLGVIIITIPPQKELSYVGENVYWRNGDATELAKTKDVARLARNF